VWSTSQELYTNIILLDLPENIRLRWKSLQGTNTLPYYKYLSNTAVKSFITLAQGFTNH
jgi:hypothetical protein